MGSEMCIRDRPDGTCKFGNTDGSRTRGLRGGAWALTVEGQPWVPARRGWVPARSSANYGSPRINGLLVVPRGFYSELWVAAQQSIFSGGAACRPAD